MKKRRVFLILSIVAVFFVSAALAQTGSNNAVSYQCSDTLDNDNDLQTDYPSDHGCVNANDNNETDITSAAAQLVDTNIQTIRTFVMPSIDLLFTEPITVDSAYLYAINEVTSAMLAVGMPPLSIPVTWTVEFNNKMVKVTPDIKLFNGLYDLVLNVRDRVDNTAVIHRKFIIDVPGTDIEVIEPHLGVSNGSVTNLTIKTIRRGANEDTVCKITNNQFVYDFNHSALVPFEPQQWNYRHTMDDFFTKANLRGSATFYILCKDKSLDRVNREMFEIYVDPTPPGITGFQFSPPKVVEYPEFENMFVMLNVTANEPVICKYSINESRDYDTGMAQFPNFNRQNFDSYTKNNNTVKVYLPDASPASHDFYVQCEDRAGWKSSVVKNTLQVDLSAAIGIEVIEPKPYTTNKSITLRMTTVKRAVCTSGKSSADMDMMGTEVTGKSHSKDLGQFDDGTYTRHIKCTSQSGTLSAQEQELDYTFVVDNTKPSAPNITGSTKTCFQDKFVFTPAITLGATDLESGIDYYLYKFDAGSTLMLNWTKTDGSIDSIEENYKGEGLNLSQTASYKITAKAVNGAGVFGTEGSVVITYAPNDKACFEKNPPLIILAKNETDGKTLVEITCTDESGCDNESYYYGLCDTESCEPTTKLNYPFMIEVLDSKYLAYNVSDIRGYSSTGTEKIEVKEGKTCGNGIKDGDETDIDCGGSCTGCLEGKSCQVNNDCGSNYCGDNVCIAAKCDDNMTNGPYGNEESDIDCGGYCGATCGLDRTCRDDDDCISSFCNPSKKACGIAGCSDGYKNGNETGVDCGEACGKDCNDKDGDGIDDDWEEQYCDGDCDPGGDLDSEGLKNIEEYRLKTNPLKKDTDGDKYTDKEEVDAGTDPLNPDDYPKSMMGILLLLVGLLFMGGGAGYLLYKKYYVEKPAQRPGQASAPMQPQKTPEQLAEERRRMEGQQRRITEERRKEMEERQKKLEELRERIEKRRHEEEMKKAEERKKLFSGFGGAARPAAQKPAADVRVKVDLKQKTVPAAAAPERTEWVSFDKLKEKFTKEVRPAAGEEAKGAQEKPGEAEEEDFSKLEEMAGKNGKEAPAKGDLFKEMEKTVKGKGAAEEEEDIYRDLENVSGRKGKKRQK